MRATGERGCRGDHRQCQRVEHWQRTGMKLLYTVGCLTVNINLGKVEAAVFNFMPQKSFDLLVKPLANLSTIFKGSLY